MTRYFDSTREGSLSVFESRAHSLNGSAYVVDAPIFLRNKPSHHLPVALFTSRKEQWMAIKDAKVNHIQVDL